MSDDDARRESVRLADELRRIVNRLALVRPPADGLRLAADVAGRFADDLDALPARSRSWEVSEAALVPGDFVDYSPVSGRRNPLAPPMRLRLMGEHEDHRIAGEVTFGAAYEGPPGHVHGGFVAAMFDELLGFAQLAPGFTAYLHVDYRKPTPLHQPLRLEGWIDRTEGRKRYAKGICLLGEVLVSEAEGLFLGPRGDENYLSTLGVEPG